MILHKLLTGFLYTLAIIGGGVTGTSGRFQLGTSPQEQGYGNGSIWYTIILYGLTDYNKQFCGFIDTPSLAIAFGNPSSICHLE